MKKMYVILPCYNEERNIGALIDEWQNQKDAVLKLGYEIMILGIDDKSTDDTAKVISRCASKDKNIRLIRHLKNQNLGGGLRTGFKIFDDECSSDDVCVVMDGDNTQSPEYICSMLKKIEEGADCVIASRYCSGSKTVGVPLLRNALSFGARLYYTLVLGVKNVRDYTCGYRVYTYQAIHSAKEKYGNKFITMRSFSCMMEVLYKLYVNGATFDEVPFVLRYDCKEGESKMRIVKTISDSLFTALNLRINTK